MKLTGTILALLAICASAAPPPPAALMNASLVAFSHHPNTIIPRAERRIELQANGVEAGDGSKCKSGLICVKKKKLSPRASLEEIILGINVFCAQFRTPTILKQKTHLFGIVMGITLNDKTMGKIEVYISNIHQPGGIVMYEAYCKTLLYQVVTGCSPGDDYKFGGYNCDETTGKVELNVQLADLRLPS